MLKGQAKTDYQREYMRKRRSNTKGKDIHVRPDDTLDLPVRPYGDAYYEALAKQKEPE